MGNSVYITTVMISSNLCHNEKSVFSTMLPHRNIYKDTVTSSYGKIYDQIHHILTGDDIQA